MTFIPKFTRRGFLLASAAGGAASLAGCGTTGAQDGLRTEAASEYRLGAADQLRITVFGEPDLTGQYVIGSQGAIAYPLIGDINAAGLTVPEFTSRLEESLRQYVRAPNVSIEVVNYRPFFILGEVNRPGSYPYSAQLTVLNAVATAGGFTHRANRSRVYIKHANATDEVAYELDNTTPAQPGDTIRIGERFF